jgi:DHA2 family metal-tetracycline-proton antiporter-like MFS transporter/DHA2 family florfenicol/chloramphenicol resistance protein-like MFS transporter
MSDTAESPQRDPGKPGKGPVSTRLLLAVMSAATFVSVFNQSMVNVAVPLIQQTYSVSESQVGWVATGYLLVFAVGVPLYGRISDLYSPKLTFCFGLVLFAAGSLACALAPSLGMLVAGRVIQAAGGAAIPALSFGLVAKLLPPGRRGFGLGIISSSIGAGAAFGPVLGGLLIQSYSWHSLFYSTLALTVFLIFGALYVVPNVVGEADGGGRSLARLDLPSGILLALAAGLLLFGVTQGQTSGLFSPVALGSFAGAVVSGVLFTRRIVRVPEPFVAPTLLGNGSFLAAASVGFLAQFANLCALFLAPILLSQVGGASSLTIGLVFLPGAALVAVLSPLAGRLSDRLGFRVMIVTGLCIMLFSHLFISSFGAGGSVWLVTVGMTTLGLGFATLNSPAANAASATLSAKEAGVGLGIYQLCFFLGAGFGPAISGAFLAFRSGPDVVAINPLYALQSATAYSDAFLVGVAAILLAFIALLGVREVKGGPAEGASG